MSWKQNGFLKFSAYLVTILSLVVSLGSGFALFLGYEKDVFTTGQFADTYVCGNMVNNQLFAYTQWLGDAENGALILFEEYDSLEAVTELPEAPLSAPPADVLEDIAKQSSLENSNLQVRVTDNATGEVILDTFGTGDYRELEEETDGRYTVEGALQVPLTVDDEYFGQAVMYGQLKGIFPDIWFVFGGSVLLSLAGLVLLGVLAGHRKGKLGITQGALEKLPTDVWVVVVAMVGCATAVIGFSAAYNAWERQSNVTYLVGLTCGAVCCLLILADLAIKTVETMAVRLKTNTFWHNTIICGLWRLVVKGLTKLPSVWRTAVLGLGICAVNGILGMCSTLGIFSWLLFAWYNLAMLVGLCMLAWQMKQLQLGAETLAKGDLQKKIDTKHMYLDCKKYGETLNTIGDGMALAVAETVKSQRLKTELITNVSHDIKTPLTSIVTCVELLQAPHSEEEHAEYLALLQRQSMKMKKLVTDLVDASKASTGNVAVYLTETDLVEVMEQALGEYAGQFDAANLTVVPHLPDACTTQADGKLLWRVLDNLLSNVCKYAQSGTRVYLTLTPGEHPVIVVKNISAQPLNMTADELMERFVRGDSARSTEGSGLGLNIAQSLMQLQHGDLKLTIDGDLVKVELFL